MLGDLPNVTQLAPYVLGAASTTLMGAPRFLINSIKGEAGNGTF